jgi:hypothetical protein
VPAKEPAKKKATQPPRPNRNRNFWYRAKVLAFGQDAAPGALNTHPGAYCAATWRYLIKTEGKMLPG